MLARRRGVKGRRRGSPRCYDEAPRGRAMSMFRTVRAPHAVIAFLIAGAGIGLLGVALFGVIHAAIIVPIWTSLLGGIPFGIVAGMAMGWALYELRTPGGPGGEGITPLAFGCLLWLTLLPMGLFGAMIRAAGMHGANDSWEVVVESMLAFGTGAGAGRILGGRWRAGLALGTASLLLTLTQAGPIPVMNSARAASLFAALGVVYVLCGLALGSAASMISGKKSF